MLCDAKKSGAASTAKEEKRPCGKAARSKKFFFFMEGVSATAQKNNDSWVNMRFGDLDWKRLSR